MKILVTGGSGFIGSAVIRKAVAQGLSVVNLDVQTYAATAEATASVAGSNRYTLEVVDINDTAAVTRVLAAHRPDAVMHLAAETHVDRSIDSPVDFVRTNVLGTVSLLTAATDYLNTLEGLAAERFRFHHVSTDEVFGALGATGEFTASTPYDPRSPYSASKASADHFARAWQHTFGLPVVVSNCSNNYGPFQFPEKLIPLVIIRALRGASLPVYGNGRNVRDWLYVEDHAEALLAVVARGEVASTHLIGGDAERTNIDVVTQICSILDRLAPASDGEPHSQRIEFVRDRPGHDFRYAIDASDARQLLGWSPATSFETGLERTVEWYIANETWWRPLVERSSPTTRVGLGF